MKVIGVGLGRTGTLSLKVALERLGFGPCFHMRNMLDHLDRLPLWRSAADGHPVDWNAVFAGYESSVDWPGAGFWRELSSFYPSAKIILTVRDPERWYDSVRQTIFQLAGGGPQRPLAQEAAGKVAGVAEVHAINRKLIWDGPLFQGCFENRDAALRAFAQHNASVRRELSSERLLVYEIAAGWQPLCNFLGVAIPDEEFPHLNDRDEFWGRVQARLGDSVTEPSRAS
jgi:hypothetical protein